jgi:hypothetical protein
MLRITTSKAPKQIRLLPLILLRERSPPSNLTIPLEKARAEVEYQKMP